MESDKKLLDDLRELAEKTTKGDNINCWHDHQPQSVCPRCGYCPHCGRGGNPMPYYPQPYPWWHEPYRYYYDSTVMTHSGNNTATLKVA